MRILLDGREKGDQCPVCLTKFAFFPEDILNEGNTRFLQCPSCQHKMRYFESLEDIMKYCLKSQ